MEHLSYSDLSKMLDKGDLSTCEWHRRKTLLAVCELAAKSKDHTPLTRWRLKQFRAALEALEGNDEIEVAGATVCETVMLAMNAVSR